MVTSENYVYSYVSPGSTLYQWNNKTKTIKNRLDCSKLVPCSETLWSISIEENLSPGKCQVNFSIKEKNYCPEFLNSFLFFFRLLDGVDLSDVCFQYVSLYRYVLGLYHSRRARHIAADHNIPTI